MRVLPTSQQPSLAKATNAPKKGLETTRGPVRGKLENRQYPPDDLDFLKRLDSKFITWSGGLCRGIQAVTKLPHRKVVKAAWEASLPIWATKADLDDLRRQLPVIQPVSAEEAALTAQHNGDDSLARRAKISRLSDMLIGVLLSTAGHASLGMYLSVAAEANLDGHLMFSGITLYTLRTGQVHLAKAFAEYLSKVPQPPDPPRKSLVERAREFVKGFTQTSPVPEPIPVPVPVRR